jgi:Rieske Fe-S protein
VSAGRDHEGQSAVSRIQDIPPGQGGVITEGSEKIAVWKDAQGKPHRLSASCTNKGCPVTWNNADGTWDCPCHGSIFQADGTVIHGPAVEPLRPVADAGERTGHSRRPTLIG